MLCFSHCFLQEGAYGGTLGRPSDAKKKEHGWDFKAAMQVLSDQGAKQPFTLLTTEHISAKRKAANKRMAGEKKALAKKDGVLAAANADEEKSESGEESPEEGDGDAEGEGGEDDEEVSNDDEDDGEDDDDDDEVDSGDEDDNGPDEEDDVKDLGVTAAETAAKDRAQRKKAREGGVDEEEAKGAAASGNGRKGRDEDGEGPRTATVDDDAAGTGFFDEYASFLPSGISKPLDGSGAGDEGGGNGDRQVAQIFFSQLNLSRPLMRGVESMGFVRPTPIQARVVPIALAGRDVCGSAVTGSGKTAAFLLPVLERLLYRPVGQAATRVLVITPTRELAAQCHAMASALSAFMDPPLMLSLITGGTKNLRPQEAELRKQPDIVICTPGRMLDHLTNSPGVHVDDLAVLVLDEVDRLLELGFKDEVEALVAACPAHRQTLLFSATMNTTVEALASLSLKRPVRVGVDVQGHTADRLDQEFIRIKGDPKKKGTGAHGVDEDRAATLAALVTRTFTDRTIVFFDTKVDAHRFGLVLGLLGVGVAELHGNLTQLQRLEALEKFRAGEVGVLLATDLAARGLDIPRVSTVINFEMPRTAATYLHRVGRTARAGRTGKSVTLIGEARRLVMKEVLRSMDEAQRGAIKTRAVAPAVLGHFKAKLDGLAEDVEALLREEAELKELRVAEMHLHRASNVLEHEEEIASRPARTWFQPESRKQAAKDASKEHVEAAARGEHQRAASELRLTPAQRLKAVEKSAKQGQGAGGGKIDTGTHKLSRKKRRRLERLAGMDFGLAEEAVAKEEEDRARQAAKAARYGDGKDDGLGHGAMADSTNARQKAKKLMLAAKVSASEVRAETAGKAAKRKLKQKLLDEANDAPAAGLAAVSGKAKEKVRARDRAEELWGAEQEAMMRELNGEGEGGQRKHRKRAGVRLEASGGFDGSGGGEERPSTVGGKGAKKAKKAGKGEDGDDGVKSSEFAYTAFDPMRVRVKKGKTARAGSFNSKSRFKRR